MLTPKLLLIAVPVLAALALVWLWFRRPSRRFHQILRQVYPDSAERPRLKVSYPYGYPAFELVFRSLPLLQQAEAAGRNAEFVHAVSAQCKDAGSKHRPFDPRTAVTFRHAP